MATDERRVAALRQELAYCEQTGNPRAGQVRDALAAAGHPVEDASEPAKRGPGRPPRKETAQDKTPKERA